MLSLPFRRSFRPTQERHRLFPPALTPQARRAWEVETILCTLHPLVREALRAWLLMPSALVRWRPLDTFFTQRFPITPEEYAEGKRSVAARLLFEELRAIRQTLDLPPEVLGGLTRSGRLTVHAIRLRQLEQWLWPFYAAREIKRLTR